MTRITTIISTCLLSACTLGQGNECEDAVEDFYDHCLMSPHDYDGAVYRHPSRLTATGYPSRMCGGGRVDLDLLDEMAVCPTRELACGETYYHTVARTVGPLGVSLIERACTLTPEGVEGYLTVIGYYGDGGTCAARYTIDFDPQEAI